MYRTVKHRPGNRHRAIAHLYVHAVRQCIHAEPSCNGGSELHAGKGVADQHQSWVYSPCEFGYGMRLDVRWRESQGGIINDHDLVRAAALEGSYQALQLMSYNCGHQLHPRLCRQPITNAQQLESNGIDSTAGLFHQNEDIASH